MSRRPATYQDVIDAPPHLRAELIDGELVLMSRGRLRHAAAIGGVYAALRERSARAEGWWIFPEVELWLGHPDPRTLVLVPDVSGWRRERFTPDLDSVGQTIVPDWVAEVLSPSSVGHDRLVKLARYAAAGVRHAWIVDPEAHTVEVYELRDGVYALVGGAEGDVEVTLPPFDAPLPLGMLWG